MAASFTPKSYEQTHTQESGDSSSGILEKKFMFSPKAGEATEAADNELTKFISKSRKGKHKGDGGEHSEASSHRSLKSEAKSLADVQAEAEKVLAEKQEERIKMQQ